MADQSPEKRRSGERRFLLLILIATAFVCVAPDLYALLTARGGNAYLGFPYNTDDHMVYAAWIRQAMNGHLLMDNRFAVDPQPGLTVNVYFFCLGQVARFLGVGLAAGLSRIAFGVLAVVLVHRILRRMELSVFATKLAIAMVIFGGGIGFLTWQNFGLTMGDSGPAVLREFLNGGLPTDVWQPEGFFLSSMLTNGLFTFSLVLILTTMVAFLDAAHRWKWVPLGVLSFAVLMNCHSYDVLTVGLVMFGVLAASIVARQVTGPWIGRALVMAAGVIPGAAWFLQVLARDPVFQARAATETYSPNFRQVLAGYLVLAAFGLVGMALRALADPVHRQRKLAGVGLAAVLFLGMAVASGGHTGGYFAGWAGWASMFAVAIAAVALMADEHPAWNLVVSWAVIGFVAIYVPELFQRKLTMGLSIPWAILAAAGVDQLIKDRDRNARNLTTVLVMLLVGGSSLRWVLREVELTRLNVSNTTRHPVYLTPEVQRFAAYLDHEPGRNVLLALPGVASPYVDERGQPIPNSFGTPSLPDLAPILTGLSGIYSYAGHWSETPNYNQRCGDLYHFFLREPVAGVRTVMTPEDRAQFIQMTGATFALLPVQAAYPQFPLVSAADLGEIVVDGAQFELIRLRR